MNSTWSLRRPQLQRGSIPSSAIGAAARPTTLLSDDSTQNKAFRLGTTESASVTLLKELLNPTLVVALLSLLFVPRALQPTYDITLMGLIALLLADRLITPRALNIESGGQPQLLPVLTHRLLLQCGVFFLVTLIAHSLHLTEMLSRTALVAWLVAMPLALLASNYCSIRLEHWLSSRRDCYRHIIIGATEVGLELAKRVERDHGAGRFMGFFDFRDPGRLPDLAQSQWIGTCHTVADFVRQHGIEAIYIALPISLTPRISELIRELRDTTASIYFVPNLIEFDLVQPRCIQIQGIPALAVCETPFFGMSALRKRAMDLTLATVGLFLTAPLLIVVALAVKLTSAGPVLFKQRRYGLNGEEICVYKFRSMTVCEDGSVVTQASRDDQRITPVGRLLRRTSLDELPQILNVLEGTMSFVGPRPHAVAHNEHYRKLISGYMIRHKVRPGITGWAQVNGLRGQTDTIDKMRARVEYDIDYLKNWSVWLDLKILLRTASLVLHDQQAY